MEKRTIHYHLTQVHRLLSEGKVRATYTALKGAAALGCSYDDMLSVVAHLSHKDFYKSMTTHADHTIWQDVYRPKTRFGYIYLKLTVIDEVLIVSFKEL